MYVEVRKHRNWPTYLVRIGDDIYEMNDNANQPNGVCMYFGNISIPAVQEQFSSGPVRKSIPAALCMAIANVARTNERLEWEAIHGDKSLQKTKKRRKAS